VSSLNDERAEVMAEDGQHVQTGTEVYAQSQRYHPAKLFSDSSALQSKKSTVVQYNKKRNYKLHAYLIL